MRTVAFGLLCLALAACTSPERQCYQAADQEYQQLVQAINVAQRNVQRGYALEQRIVQRPGPRFCLGANNRFGGGVFGGISTCRGGTTRVVERPVPLNIEAEQAKLDSMLDRLPLAQQRAQAYRAACFQRYGS